MTNETKFTLGIAGIAVVVLLIIYSKFDLKGVIVAMLLVPLALSFKSFNDFFKFLLVLIGIGIFFGGDDDC